MFAPTIFVSILPLVFYTHSIETENEKCYEEMSIDYSIHYDEPMIGWEMGEEIVFQSSSIPFVNPEGGYYSLDSEAAKNFLDLVSAAHRDGFKIGVNSAYRTNREQIEIKRKKKHWAAEAGWSNHQRGLAVDLAGTNAFVPENKINPKHFSKRCQAKKIGGVQGYKCPTRLFWWLKRNAAQYGFYNTVRKETWHWVYLGFKPTKRLVKK